MNLEYLLLNIFLIINIVYLMFLNVSIKYKTLPLALINIAYYNFFILKKKIIIYICISILITLH